MKYFIENNIKLYKNPRICKIGKREDIRDMDALNMLLADPNNNLEINFRIMKRAVKRKGEECDEDNFIFW